MDSSPDPHGSSKRLMVMTVSFGMILFGAVVTISKDHVPQFQSSYQVQSSQVYVLRPNT